MSWRSQNGFFWTPMKYTNSCFPNCLGAILKNFGADLSPHELEDEWNGLQIARTGKGLDKEPPTFDDVKADLQASMAKFGSYRVVGTERGVFTKEDCDGVRKYFQGNNAAMIFWMQGYGGHANLFLKKRGSKCTLYVDPSPGEDFVIFAESFSLEYFPKPSSVLLNYTGAEPDGKTRTGRCGGTCAILLQL